MLKRVNEILIGKDIDRYTGGFGGASINTIQEHIAEGEVTVLTQDFKGYTVATDSFATTPIIYIVEGSADVRTEVKPDGSEVSIRRLIVSAPIDGRRVRVYSKKDYVAKTEESVTFGAIQDTIVAGTEFVLRLVYKDMVEHPGQFTETYRYVTKSGDASVDVFDGLRKRITNNKGKLSIKGGARITPNALAQATLVLTGKKIPACTSSVKDIDELTQVEFEAFLNYVDNDGNWVEVTNNPVKSYTKANRGQGVWEVIRDTEKQSLSYRGIENRIWFPVAYPLERTQKDGQYNSIVIEHEAQYRSSDNQYDKETSLTTHVVFEKSLGNPTTHQGSVVEDDLDDWMASLPASLTGSSLTW